MMIWGAVFVIAILSSAIITGLLRRYALAKQLLDMPNARSSHHLPTPRGGGLAIVIVFLAGLWGFAESGLLMPKALWALVGAGAGVAWVGFVDDHNHIPARWRLLAHFAAGIWGLSCLAGFPPAIIAVSGFSVGLANLWYWLWQLVGLVYLVWLLNLYNFMDGIDGLASIEAITTCIGGALLYLLAGQPLGLAAVPLLLAVTVAGFLVWNFPPAKIFMGDAGSGFLGIVLGLFSVQAAHLAPQFFWSWLILLGVFIVDASWTLLRRFGRGEKVYEAHRSHAYQFASRQFGSHKTVTLAIAAINLFWLLPLALAVGLAGLNVWLGVLLAYTPLLILAVYFRAGQRE